MELEAEVSELKQKNQELKRKQVKAYQIIRVIIIFYKLRL